MKRIMVMLAALVLFALPSALKAQVAVIVNKGTGAGSLSAAKVADLFSMGTKTWSNGTKVVLIDQRDGAQKDKFYGFLGKSHADLKKIWLRMQLSGEGRAPEALSDDAVVAKVASTPGAIGYVSASKVSDDVKVVATIP